MKWNCPHCLTPVSVSSDKIGEAWTFSRCYKCTGYSLVRRAEVEVLKVDGSPFDGKIQVQQGTAHPATPDVASKSAVAPEPASSEPAPKKYPSLYEEIEQIESRQRGRSRWARALLGSIACAVVAGGYAAYQKPIKQNKQKILNDQIQSEQMSPARFVEAAVQAENALVLEGPAPRYARKAALPKGTMLTILERRDGWARTVQGWIALRDLGL